MENNTKNAQLFGDKGAKKDYKKPVLKEHGGLSELVQLRPDRGPDGETRWTDCTSA
ncbi:MAG: hypothetical protein ACKOXB_06245 [Flavobacteriales bacterium]